MKDAADKQCVTDPDKLNVAMADFTEDDWCTVSTVSDLNQVCAPGMTLGYKVVGTKSAKILPG